MIVLDEQLQGAHIRDPIMAWYKGRVVSIRQLRANTLILDEAVPTLLRTVSAPTFVTINVVDFWKQVEAEHHFAIVCLELPNARAFETSIWLRRFCALPQFNTKAKRMGMVALLRPTRIEYYRNERKIEILNW